MFTQNSQIKTAYLHVSYNCLLLNYLHYKPLIDLQLLLATLLVYRYQSLAGCHDWEDWATGGKAHRKKNDWICYIIHSKHCYYTTNGKINAVEQLITSSSAVYKSAISLVAKLCNDSLIQRSSRAKTHQVERRSPFSYSSTNSKSQSLWLINLWTLSYGSYLSGQSLDLFHKRPRHPDYFRDYPYSLRDIMNNSEICQLFRRTPSLSEDSWIYPEAFILNMSLPCYHLTDSITLWRNLKMEEKIPVRSNSCLIKKRGWFLIWHCFVPSFLHRAWWHILHGSPQGVRSFNVERAAGTQMMARSVEIVHKRLAIGLKVLVHFYAWLWHGTGEPVCLTCAFSLRTNENLI